MQHSMQVIFEGEVLRPVEPLDLTPNQQYRVIIENEARESGIIDDIVTLAQDLDHPPDVAAQRDHYLYGTPRR